MAEQGRQERLFHPVSVASEGPVTDAKLEMAYRKHIRDLGAAVVALEAEVDQIPEENDENS